jgi:hypothetical protein
MLACAGLAAAAGTPAAQGGPGATWRVVLMRGWDSLYPINLTREKALRETITDGAPRLVEFFPEEIDPLRFLAHRSRHRGAIAAQVRRHSDRPRHRVGLRFTELQPGTAIHLAERRHRIQRGVRGLRGAVRRHRGRHDGLDIEAPWRWAARSSVDAPLYVVSGSSTYDREILVIAMQKLARVGRPSRSTTSPAHSRAGERPRLRA